MFQYYPRIDLDGLKGPAPESGWVMVGHDYCGTIKVMDGVGVLPFSE